MIRLGRFTARGGPEVEARIADVVREAAAIGHDAIPPSELRALVLVGGYGRGEGGVEVVDGLEQPHNNLDLLLVTTGWGVLRTESLRRRLSRALEPLARRAGIGIDVGAVSDVALQTAPCRVLWYDARFGHQTVLGDPVFLPSLDRFTPDRLLPADVRDLVVNRGTLLVINDAVADLPDPPAGSRKTLVRHAVKAVLGYGDALLYWRGVYHWSYVERQRRMAARNDVPAAFRNLYDTAMEFRFRPDYGPWQSRDPRAWLDEVRAAVEPVHREVEGRRCGVPGLTWADYPSAAFHRGLRDGLSHPREAARRVRALARPLEAGEAPADAGGTTVATPWADSVVVHLTPPRDLLGIVFPVVAYRLRDPGFRSLARRVLGSGDDDADLRRSFLRAWGRHGDPNFEAAARRLGLDLEPGGTP